MAERENEIVKIIIDTVKGIHPIKDKVSIRDIKDQFEGTNNLERDNYITFMADQRHPEDDFFQIVHVNMNHIVNVIYEKRVD